MLTLLIGLMKGTRLTLDDIRTGELLIVPRTMVLHVVHRWSLGHVCGYALRVVNGGGMHVV